MYENSRLGVMGFWTDLSPTTGALLTDNVWHHVAVTFDGTTLKTYVDGVLGNIASKTYATTGQN
jgi:hypothetical protein